jgi:hypothetical protein
MQAHSERLVVYPTVHVALPGRLGLGQGLVL